MWHAIPRTRGERIRLVVLIGLITLAVVVWLAWSPGVRVTDGRHDRAANGIWLSHGWLGGDVWFERNDKLDERPRYRSAEALASLFEQLHAHHMRDLFPHLAPANYDGSLPTLHAASVHAFLDHAEARRMRVMPWIGGVYGVSSRPDDQAWRERFCAAVRHLLAEHPRFAGIHLNVEPWPSGDLHMLRLLAELRLAIPRDRLISVAAYPPPTVWHRFPDLHWQQEYYEQVAKRCDQLAVMMYDTALISGKLYTHLMSRWTVETLDWAGHCDVLLGVPTYEDAWADYHDPNVENLHQALLGIHHGLIECGAPANYQGIAIYSHWETDHHEWAELRRLFLKADPVTPHR
jgi:hypothetical protein